MSDYRIIIFVHPVEPVPGCNCYVRTSLSTQHRAVATCAVFPIMPAWGCVSEGSEQAQNSDFESWTGQNVSPPLRFILATTGVTALSLCYTGIADSRSHIEEIPCLVWNLNVQYRIRKSPSHYLTVFAKEANPHCPTIFL